MIGDMAHGNGAARHFAVENFRDYAFAELQAAAPWHAGICFNPGCSRRFTPSRDWQMYCCPSCERTGSAEMRRWGHRLALPTLIHRIGKYERHSEPVRALNRSARRHLARLSSEWLADRQARAKAAKNC